MASFVAATGLLAGCATYAPLPLGDGRGATSVSGLDAAATTMPARALAARRLDPSDGLDVAETVRLAVASSPRLKVLRDQAGVARAQAFDAGLLPDPQLGLGADFPTGPGQGASRAFSLGLGEDLGAWLTRSDRVAAARDQRAQAVLELVWAEWQTMARARLLFDLVRHERRREQRLRDEVAALAPLEADVRRALATGDLGQPDAAEHLGTLADARSQLAQTSRAREQSEYELRMLLGLAPTVPLHLTGAPHPAAPGRDQVMRALAALPQRRPDLLALQRGYAAQEATLRGAILAQFPAITVGFSRARDTSDIYTRGFTIGLTLPLFNRNRGQIAIQRATRQQLHDDYDARLLQARSDVLRLQAGLVSMHAQIHTLAAHAHRLDGARDAARHAWQARLLAWPAYLATRTGALQADLALDTLREEYARQSITLETLLGGSVPAPATVATTRRTEPRS
jgi:outer membrane protein TolC